MPRFLFGPICSGRRNDSDQLSRICTFLVTTDRQGSRRHADVRPTVYSWPFSETRTIPMSRGLATNISKGAEPDHMVEFKEGVELLKTEYPEKALVKLRNAFESDKRNPYYISFLGLSIARAEQNWEYASELCETAVELKRKEIKFHLNLVEVYALAGLREKALRRLDKASKIFGDDPRLKRFRLKMVERRPPVLPFLGRDHFLNRELGKFRHHMLKKQGK
jgi:tetratricopeptide (TPR) repeat protein